MPAELLLIVLFVLIR